MTEKKEHFWNRMVPELTVTDFPVSLHFYVSVLGFNIMIKRKEPDFAYLNLGEAQLMLEHTTRMDGTRENLQGHTDAA
ncbi:hypothetical protein SAMN05518863_106167 [Candidatus Pantoea symbiotica]|uniref:Glyoxalase/fosfomycin resistance/dioxygenase domain-containing protein n=1 Tax=Candidatus Pantoea symbiotica TaxID=1884370 RepID=A0A1I3YRE2_9GAMM|nr:hypothetical protein SAMN05518863_106167 [Pantoea symbiotica]SFU86753.1 hypothetical protein SAMN05518864_106166 [Pantoea sp. YR525]